MAGPPGIQSLGCVLKEIKYISVDGREQFGVNFEKTGRQEIQVQDNAVWNAFDGVPFMVGNVLWKNVELDAYGRVIKGAIIGRHDLDDIFLILCVEEQEWTL